MYQPTLARFTARDPLPQNGPVLMGRVPSSVYAYTENNPIVQIDPSGMVIVDFRPKNVFTHPWSVNNKGKYLGETNETVRSVNCTCVCVTPTLGGLFGAKSEYKLECTVSQWTSIELNFDRIKADDATVEGVYAHEQRHAICLRLFATGLAAQLQNEEDAFGSTEDGKACLAKASAIGSRAQKAMYDFLVQEKNHKNACSPKDKKTDYDVLSPPMPDASD